MKFLMSVAFCIMGAGIVILGISLGNKDFGVSVSAPAVSLESATRETAATDPRVADQLKLLREELADARADCRRGEDLLAIRDQRIAELEEQIVHLTRQLGVKRTADAEEAAAREAEEYLSLAEQIPKEEDLAKAGWDRLKFDRLHLALVAKFPRVQALALMLEHFDLTVYERMRNLDPNSTRAVIAAETGETMLGDGAGHPYDELVRGNFTEFKKLGLDRIRLAAGDRGVEVLRELCTPPVDPNDPSRGAEYINWTLANPYFSFVRYFR